jgi:transcriptional regulator with XRE-family HTH domain
MLPERQITFLYKELGARIKKHRELKGFKQAPFAELLKISRASLVNIEKGRQHSPLHNLYEIARLLGLSVAELIPELLEEPKGQLNEEIEKQIEISSAGNTEIQQKLKEFALTITKLS